MLLTGPSCSYANDQMKETTLCKHPRQPTNESECCYHTHTHTRTLAESTVPAFCIFIAGRRTCLAERGKCENSRFMFLWRLRMTSRRRRRLCPVLHQPQLPACLQPYKFSQFILLSRTFIAFDSLISRFNSLFSANGTCTCTPPANLILVHLISKAFSS